MTALVNGLGGAAGFGENVLATGDDNSSAAISLTTVFTGGFNFFGTTYNNVFINNNGNLTFDAAQSTYSPTVITNASRPILAAFYADVDTRGGAVSPSPGGTSTGSNRVYYDLDLAAHKFTVTWDDVGYYQSRINKTNAFQIEIEQLSGSSSNFRITYRYENVDWTTGDASGGSNGLGGTVARAGYAAGDGQTSYELPQSGNQAGMLGLDDQPGFVVFQAINGEVTTAPVASDDAAQTRSGVSVTIDAGANDYDTDGTIASYTTTVDPANGTVAAGANPGEFIYTPDAGFTGIDTFTYQVTDDAGATDTATVSISVGARIDGTAGADVISQTVSPAGQPTTTAFGDEIYGNGGNDVIEGGGGGDIVSGGSGSDTASYENAAAGLTASLLSPGSNTGAAEDDSYTSIENLRGSAFADILSGDGSNNIIEGGGGADQITGNGGNDTASYEHSGAGVSVDLASGTNTGGDAQDDTLTGIRNLIGTAQIDTLTGDGNSNALRGGASADILTGAGGNDILKGEGGDDAMTGGLGNDSYVVDSQGDVIHEDAGLGSGQDTVLATVDYALADGEEIETLRAYSGFSDLTLSGNDKANTVAGSDGDDTLDGGGANDRLFGFEGADILQGGTGDDRLDGGADADDMSGGAGADTYFVDDAMDAVHESDDVGTDTVFASSSFTLGDGEKVEVLRAVGSSGLQLDGNDLANSVVGGGGIDILGGAGGADSLFGLDGNDTLISGDDSDKLSGGDDDDWLTGGAGLDLLTGGAGTDRFVFETVSDSRGSTRDLISDFSKTDGDVIDLQSIDADANTGGDDAFDFIGATAFTGVAGQVRQVQAGTNTLVEGDVTGDGKADFAVMLRGVYLLDAGDFSL